MLRGDIVEDDSGSSAMFTEQGSSASQMTAAKGILRSKWMMHRLKKKECPDVWIRLPKHINGRNHGPVWKTSSFLLNEICTVILWQDYCGKGNLKKFYRIMDWELRVAEHEARHNECVQDSVKVAALKRMMTTEMAERYIEGPNTYPGLRSRVAAYVGEKMIQQSHVPMDIGEVEGEIEGSDDQIDELRGARKPRRDERSTHQRGPGKQPWRASPLGRLEKREADNGLVCYNCGGKGHPARLCPTPSDQAAHAVDEEGDTEEESSDEGDVCGVEWECEVNGTGDGDDDILGMGCESAEQSKWERLAAENVLPAGVCNHVKLSATRRSDAGIGFRSLRRRRENPQSRSEEVQG